MIFQSSFSREVKESVRWSSRVRGKKIKNTILEIQDGGRVTESYTNLFPRPIWNHN